MTEDQVRVRLMNVMFRIAASILIDTDESDVIELQFHSLNEVAPRYKDLDSLGVLKYFIER